MRLETPAQDDQAQDDQAQDTPTRDAHSCGAHLAESVQELARWARERRRDPAQVVVYANEANAPADPFDRIVLGAIPI